MATEQQRSPVRLVGRYAIYGKIASGGMATVHFGRLLGPVGFARTVAIKCLHPQFTEDPDFVSMFVDEARLAARIRHPSVVPTLDVVATDRELFLVMEFVQGETLLRILRRLAPKGERIPLPIVAAIFSNVLHGLHAAHEARSERGTPLEIVHRDVSPHNVIVGVDGTTRVLDFGVAKAVGRLQTTRKGQLKGKLAYIAPEQLRGAPATRQTDLYATAVCLWEALTGKRLFEGASEAALVGQVLAGDVARPSTLVPDLPAALDALVLRGLDREPANRFASAREMATALEAAVPQANPAVVGAWIEHTAAETIAFQAAQLAEIESASSEVTVPTVDDDATMPSPPPPTEPSHADTGAAAHEPMYSVSMTATGLTKANAAPESVSEAPVRPRRPVRALLLVGGAAAAALVTVLVVALRGPDAGTLPQGAAPVTSERVEPPSLPSADTPTRLSTPAPTEAPAAADVGSASASPATSGAPTVAATTRRRPPSSVAAPTTPPAATKRAPPAATHGAIVFTNPG